MSNNSTEHRIGCFTTFFGFIGVLFLLFLLTVTFVTIQAGSKNQSTSATQKATSAPTASPTATAPADDALSWAKYYASLYETRDIDITGVDITTTDQFGTYITVDLDILCDHSDTKLQFSHFNKVIIDISEAMSKHTGFDSLWFTAKDTFVNKYGEYSKIVTISADYSIATLKRINYDYHRSFAYTTPTAFIECADTHFVHQGYNLSK